LGYAHSYRYVFGVCVTNNNGLWIGSLDVFALRLQSHLLRISYSITANLPTPQINRKRIFFLETDSSQELSLQITMKSFYRFSFNHLGLPTLLNSSQFSNANFLSSSSRIRSRSSNLLPATRQHAHTWHQAPLGPMIIYWFNVKSFVFFSFH
jgi:hypothetical protein